ncbi:MAG: DUF2309 domain-containing protein [Chromatiales bacterium]
MSNTANHSGDIRAQIRQLVADLDHLLPAQAPIKDFVHHNTLHGLQHLPFQEALGRARRLTGARGYLPAQRYQAHYAEGRIRREDLLAVIDEADDLSPQIPIAELSDTTLRRRDIYQAALLLPPGPVSGCQLNWQIEEKRALERLDARLASEPRKRLLAGSRKAGLDSEAAATADLWQACLEALHLEHQPLHPEELFDLTPELAETLLDDMLERTPEQSSAPAGVKAIMRQAAHDRLAQQLAQLGRGDTLRDMLLALTGQDLLDEIRQPLIRTLSTFLDQGVAGRDAVRDELGLYDFWRRQMERDPSWQLQSIRGWRQHLELLQRDPLDTLISELQRMGLPRACWTGYLQQLALELPGWSGMVLWRHNHPGYQGLETRVHMLDYLAVRLVLERIHAHNLCASQFKVEASIDMLRWYLRRHHEEYTVRDALFSGKLPEYLASRAQRAVNAPPDPESDNGERRWSYLAQLIWTWRHSGLAQLDDQPTLCQGAWPLFLLAQHLGLCGAELRAMSREQVEQIFACVERLDDDRSGFLWLQAYEKNYRDQILNALARNRGRGAWPDRPQPPLAQLVFCMDDREEGIRRHLEELLPQVETLGAAAHYSVPHNWRGLDDTDVTPLAPVVPTPVIPAHEVCEQPRDEARATTVAHRRWHRRLQQWQETLLTGSRRGLLLPGLLSALAAPATLGVLGGKVLMPRRFGEFVRALRRQRVKPLATRIDFVAPNDSPQATPESPRLGFTDREQADRVQALLRSMGLSQAFSPLVAIIGHGSRNQNNPHASAYNCGACAGHFSGPNARLVATMANRSEVRALLAQRGIHIPDDSHFIGAEHDTCNDQIEWYDLSDVPAELRPRLQQVSQALAQAARQHAQERCRRFASAPARPNPRQAFTHVAGRGLDFSQARPELGHATNACAFFGRRAMSRGAFFDRRAFLISYDASQDPQGELLEQHLLINGAVGAGISLEYYFSTVDNEGYGCGSKVMHNVTGFLGVMEGAGSDLRTGLPQQMIEIHEAMRLLVVVETTTETLSRIYQRQPPLRQLVGNGWVQLVAMDPHDGALQRFLPDRGWLEWLPDREQPLATVARSADWYLDSDGPLPPALIDNPEEAARG